MIYVDRGNINLNDISSVSEWMEKGMVSTATPQVTEFENKITQFLNVKCGVATNSGTAALHLSLVAAGVGIGDEVIIPSLTFIATANAVLYVGATPVFCAVRPDTWTLDFSVVKELISTKTKAIIPVHLYGSLVDVFELNKIKKGITIIEDASEALGSIFPNGSFAGTVGDYGCFSFNGNKLITTGGGGLVVCGSGKAEMIRSLSIQAKDDYGHWGVGHNYRMTGLSAALGLSQIERINEFVSQKNRFREIYENELPELKFQTSINGSVPCWWLSAALIPEKIRVNELRNYLQKEEVETRPVFNPIPRNLAYRNYYDYRNCSEAIKIHQQGICLPSSTLNTEKDIMNVCKLIKSYLKIK